MNQSISVNVLDSRDYETSRDIISNIALDHTILTVHKTNSVCGVYYIFHFVQVWNNRTEILWCNSNNKNKLCIKFWIANRERRPNFQRIERNKTLFSEYCFYCWCCESVVLLSEWHLPRSAHQNCSQSPLIQVRHSSLLSVL